MVILLKMEILLIQRIYQAIHMAGDSQAQATLFDLILERSGDVVTFSNNEIVSRNGD